MGSFFDKGLYGEAGYLALLAHILNSAPKTDRTGTGTLSHFGAQIRFDLTQGFPLFSTKRVYFKAIAYELLWFLSGNTRVDYLHQHGITIWDEWATDEVCARFGLPTGELGKIYGHQWRNFGGTLGANDGFDQIKWLINEIKQNPSSRRLIITGWNPYDAHKVALPPCHTLFQFFVQDGKLSCQLYQRSADMFLGVPFNVASYALLTHIIAMVCDLSVGDFIWTGGDCHIYANHVAQVKTQISRTPLPLPTLTLDKVDDIFAFDYHHIHLHGYTHHPKIDAPVAV